MKWNVTAEDVSKSALVDPGWHPTEVAKFEVKKAKDGESNNAVYVFKNLSPQFAGAECIVYFSEKLPLMMAPLLLALGFPQNPDGSISADLDEATLKGKRIRAHWVRGSYNNKPQNQIDEYDKLPS